MGTEYDFNFNFNLLVPQTRNIGHGTDGDSITEGVRTLGYEGIADDTDRNDAVRVRQLRHCFGSDHFDRVLQLFMSTAPCTPCDALYLVP